MSLHFIECNFASIGHGGSVGKRIWARGITHGGCKFEKVCKNLVFIFDYLFSLYAQYFE